MIYTALSHRNSPRQRDRAVSNLQWGRDDRPVMPDVRTPTGLIRARPMVSPRQKQEAPSAEQSTLRASRQRRQGLTTGGTGATASITLEHLLRNAGIFTRILSLIERRRLTSMATDLKPRWR